MKTISEEIENSHKLLDFLSNKTISVKKTRYGYKQDRKISNDLLCYLDDSFEKIENIPGLKTTLYQHQTTVVAAMHRLESTRIINAKNISSVDGEYGKLEICYNAAVLSEPVGSGKTIDILALILYNKMPRVLPDMFPLGNIKNTYDSKNDICGVFRRRFKNFFKCTIIFVGISVVRQWTDAIKKFTNLEFFVVNNVIDLNKLFTFMDNGTINDYNIILVKNGIVTAEVKLPFNIPLSDINKKTTPSIMNLISNVNTHCWFRVIVDDFDVVKIPHVSTPVPALFTWFVSSTRKVKNGPTDTRNSDDISGTEILLNHTLNYQTMIELNDPLFTVLNVRNTNKYITETSTIPSPKYHVVKVPNLNNLFITAFSELEVDHTLMEMINSDAISEAAKHININAESVADIFNSLLGNKFKLYKYAVDLLEFIDYCRSTEDDRLEPPPDAKYYKSDLLKFKEIEYQYPKINKLLDLVEEEYIQVKNNNSLIIDRIKSSISYGKCGICNDDLMGKKELFINKCCNTIFCGECGLLAQRLLTTFGQKKLQKGTCANCRAGITLKDLIYIGDCEMLQKIQNDEFDSSEEESEVLNVDQHLKNVSVNDIDYLDTDVIIGTTKSTNTNVKTVKNKYSFVVDIIKKNYIEESKRIDLCISNMMKGSCILPEAPVRKVLIFANYEETLTKVVTALENNNIKYWRLKGASTEIHNTANLFTECKTECALVINSTTHCSGLNLQTATDLIFTHRIVDKSIESQVVGRGHRLGRTSPLNIHYLLYDYEISMLTQQNSFRYLSESEVRDENSA